MVITPAGKPDQQDIVIHSKTLLSAALFLISLTVFGQEGVDYDLKKPPKFENRILASEKSNNGKKFKKSRRFIQNTITHYNFYYNANVKLDQVIARAKSQNRDDYTKLLPFYNYSLDNTANQKKELDSVIYKCNMGILIHDTRNDWIDNLYMLIGRTYFLKKYFDSAFITFQFTNRAWGPKDDGYPIPIGSNIESDQGQDALMISTKEKPNVLQKVFSLPPSRNDALVWKIRTYIAKDQYGEAASLIEILKHDPQFPPRLHGDLQEVQALWFYRQEIYDSAAWYLERALPVAENKEEQARWEYLIAQLYERLNESYQAKTFYERTISHTYNPVLEVYARLNAIRQNKDAGEDFIQKNIDALVKMARKDRYESYRDIIYYTAAQMELERKNRPGAEAFLLRCIRSAGTGTQRNKAFLQLANMSFEDKQYRNAKNYYDSLNLGDRSSLGDISWLPDRKAALAIIVNQLRVIERQDSLQRIAALPPAQRDAYIKKLVRMLRRQQGLRDEDDTGGGGPLNPTNQNVADLFGNTSADADWYFSNPNLKAKGYNDFKTKWGNRANTDNWQLASLAAQAKLRSGDRAAGSTPDVDSKAAAATGAISFKSLLNNLPLTPEKLKKSNDSIENALFKLGKAYQEGIPDYPYAITTYDSLLQRFPSTPLRPESLMNLYYCYKKIGDEVNAARILELMQQRYPDSKFTARAVDPDAASRAENSQREEATHRYEKIYTDFIEGNFEQALAQKKAADSLYGDKYWTPQLLYIESVYFIRNREDGKAIATLGNITSKYPNTPMADKAATLIDVLKRRRQIEDYLTKLQVKRIPDDSVVVDNTPTPRTANDRTPRLVRNDSNMLVKEDTSQLARARVHAISPANNGAPKTQPGITGPDKVKVDAGNLAQVKMSSTQLDQLHRQIDSIQAALVKAQSDSAQAAILKRQSDSLQAAVRKAQADTARLANNIRALNSIFSFTPDQPHSVLIVLDKVDPVYVTESKNAFDRYNQENYYSQGLTINNTQLSDSLKFVVIGGFPNSDEAMSYLQTAKAMAPRAIVPWLPANKYTFLVISSTNLDRLLNSKDLAAYRKFLSTAYPGKF